MVVQKTTKKRPRELLADSPTDPAIPEGAYVTTRSTCRKQCMGTADPVPGMARAQAVPVEVEISWRNESTFAQCKPSSQDQVNLDESSNRGAIPAKRQQTEVKMEPESGNEAMLQSMDHVHEKPPKFLKETATIQEKTMELEREWMKLTHENATLKAEKQNLLRAAAAQGRSVKALEKTAKALEETVSEKDVLLIAQETRIRSLEGALQEKGAVAAAQSARMNALEAIAKDELGTCFIQAFVAHLCHDKAGDKAAAPNLSKDLKAKLQDMKVKLAKTENSGDSLGDSDKDLPSSG